MVHSSSVRRWLGIFPLVVVILVLRSLLILLPRTMICIMSTLATTIAHIGVVGHTILHWGVVEWFLVFDKMVQKLLSIGHYKYCFISVSR